MWIYSKEQNVWVNLDTAMRISKDGNGGYIITSTDGRNTKISQVEYDLILPFLDPEWYEKYPNNKGHNPNKGDEFDMQEAIKSIMKATGAKMKEEKKEEEN